MIAMPVYGLNGVLTAGTVRGAPNEENNVLMPSAGTQVLGCANVKALKCPHLRVGANQ